MNKGGIVERFNVLRNILDKAKGAAEVASFLYYPKSVDISNFIRDNQFFDTIKFSTLQTATVEIHKFVGSGKNDEFQFYKVLNFIEDHIADCDRIIKWKRAFDSIEVYKINISKLRNKRYAHFDQNGIDYENYIQDLIYVIDLCRNIFQEMCEELEIDLKLTYDDNYPDIYNGRQFLKFWCDLN